MGGRIIGEDVSWKGAKFTTIVFGRWHKGDNFHVVGVFDSEEKAIALVEEEKARGEDENPRFAVWHETFITQ